MRTIFAPLCLLVLGCGNSVAPGDQLVYARLQGVINAGTAVPTDPVRLALVWYRHLPGPTGTDEGGQIALESQDFRVQVAFPAKFEIDLAELPPKEALFDGTASASIVVYQDSNGNGKLDFTSPSDSDFRDHLLGTLSNDTASFSILFIDSPSSAETNGLPLGLSIFQGNVESDGSISTLSIPISTPLTIQLSDDPAVSCYLVNPLPTKVPVGGVGLGYEASECDGNVAPAGSLVTCGPYTGAPFYQAWTAVPTSPEIKKLCGPAYQVCLIDSPAPANLSCQ